MVCGLNPKPCRELALKRNDAPLLKNMSLRECLKSLFKNTSEFLKTNFGVFRNKIVFGNWILKSDFLQCFYNQTCLWTEKVTDSRFTDRIDRRTGDIKYIYFLFYILLKKFKLINFI